MIYFRIGFYAVLLILLTGCSQKIQNVNATIQEGLFGFDDIEMTASQVAEIEYASIYTRINQGPRVFMVLAFVDINPVTGNQQLKWVSADGAMITTENGRITKTTALPHTNLHDIRSSNNLAAPNKQVSSWQAEFDWQPGYHFSQSAIIKSFPVGITTTSSLLWIKPTLHVREITTFTNQQQMQSEFWIDKQGKVVKSAQSLVPDQLFIEIEVLKPYSG